jgi:hypothetical protein
LAQKINDDADLRAIGWFARPVGNVVRMYTPVNNGPLQRPTIAFAPSGTGGATLATAIMINGSDQRSAALVTLLDPDGGHWQNAFYSANGAADFALVVGRTLRTTAPASTGNRSQAIKWWYTDNTTAGTQRTATLYIDPVGAGATGADMVLGNNSGQATNLSVPVGNIKVGAMPTSAGAGGLAVCIDTAGVMYKKAACP